MQHTQNYQLSRWEKDDRIMMEDFNADNEAIDAALAAKADAEDVTALGETVAALTAGLGSGGQNARIAWGSYTGNGKYGSGNPTSLTFDFKPMYIVVTLGSAVNATYGTVHLVRGMPISVYNTNYLAWLTWYDNGVSLAADSSAGQQMNDNGQLYYYVAIGQDLNDDTVLIDLGQAALSADLAHGVGSLNNILGSIVSTIGVGVIGLRGLDAHIRSDLALGGGDSVGGFGLGLDGGILGLLGVDRLVAIVIAEPLVLGTTPVVCAVGALGEVEVLLTEGLSLGGHDRVGNIAESGRVLNRVNIGGNLEQELSHELTGSSGLQGNALDVLEDLELLGDLGNMELPVSAFELTVLAVADSTEDHGESLIAGDRIGRTELAVAVALDKTGVGAEANITGSPGSAGHVIELAVAGIQTGLLVLDIAGVETINDRRYFSAGDGTFGLEGTVFIAFEYAHAIENGNSFFIGSVDILGIGEGCVADGAEAKSHNQCEHQRE